MRLDQQAFRTVGDCFRDNRLSDKQAFGPMGHPSDHWGFRTKVCQNNGTAPSNVAEKVFIIQLESLYSLCWCPLFVRVRDCKATVICAAAFKDHQWWTVSQKTRIKHRLVYISWGYVFDWELRKKQINMEETKHNKMRIQEFCYRGQKVTNIYKRLLL